MATKDSKHSHRPLWMIEKERDESFDIAKHWRGVLETLLGLIPGTGGESILLAAIDRIDDHVHNVNDVPVGRACDISRALYRWLMSSRVEVK